MNTPATKATFLCVNRHRLWALYCIVQLPREEILRLTGWQSGTVEAALAAWSLPRTKTSDEWASVILFGFLMRVGLKIEAIEDHGQNLGYRRRLAQSVLRSGQIAITVIDQMPTFAETVAEYGADFFEEDNETDAATLRDYLTERE